MFFDNDWQPIGEASPGGIFDTCTGDTSCSQGPAGYDPAVFLDQPVNATSVSYGVRCTLVGGGSACITGAIAHNAWAALYGAELTVSDPSNPAVANPSGELWDGSAFHHGTEEVSFEASDNTGIRRTRVLVDGAHASNQDRACDFSFMKPCADPPGAITHAVDTTNFPDGARTLRAAAYDSALNEGSEQITVAIDNTAPAQPGVLLVAGGPLQSGAAFSASWQEPEGQVAPITQSHYKLCSVSNPADCPVAGQAGPSSLAAPMPQHGIWLLSVWLEDAAGNVSPANASTSYVVFQPPGTGNGPGGGSPKTPRASGLRISKATLSHRDNRLRVSGRIAQDLNGTRLRLRFSARTRRRSVLVKRNTHVRNGRFHFAIRLQGRAAAAKRGSVVVTFAGTDLFAAASRRFGVRAP